MSDRFLIPEVVAVVPAAGAGRRFGAGAPKSFRELAGRTILARTLDALAAAPSIGGLVVAAPPDRLDEVRRLVPDGAPLLAVVAGGEERFDSVRNALAAVPEGTAIVVVHDAARPLVTARETEEAIEAARRYGAALTVSAPVETVKRIDGDRVTATLDRDLIRLAQTPQAFRADLLRRAFRTAEEDGVKGTDEASLVERLGEPVVPVEADRWNRKITVEEDLRLAEWVLREVRR
ncbi:MAG: 2-C-methyl-D-erythritol 4-phosphate cytidylyltransferase [Candidatus Eisenbacteria bacterium]|nr:2-C-methyl-D-erythritol 4-phosphate cytidylyltransferase [Candidatus Eisenbacteria bacterium]